MFTRAFCATIVLLGGLGFPSNADAPDRSAAAPLENPTGALTLANALALALLQNPALAVYTWEIRAAEARALQAGLRPNPELSLDVEDIRWMSGPGSITSSGSLSGALTRNSIAIPSGNGQTISVPALGLSPAASLERGNEQGARSGFSEAEITLSLSQLIELGGKRAKRIRLAEREKDLAQWDFEAARADVVRTVATEFVNVLAAQERLKLDDELVSVAEQVHSTVSKQVQAGAVSPIEATKAQVVLDATRIERERAARNLDSKRVALSATWDKTRPVFGEALGRLDDVREIPALDALESNIARNPDVARWTDEMARRDAAFELARAQRIPDPTVSLGFRSTGIGPRGASNFGFDTGGGLSFDRSRTVGESSRDNRLVFGISIPLPLFDRNQGAIEEAEYLAQKTSEQRRAARNEASANIASAYQELLAAHHEIQLLSENILPAATETFEKTQEGYRQGKFGYLEVLDAERTLFDARQQYLDALTNYHVLLVQLERLTGLPIPPIEPNTKAPTKESGQDAK